jgi:hypothetical protein
VAETRVGDPLKMTYRFIGSFGRELSRYIVIQADAAGGGDQALADVGHIWKPVLLFAMGDDA